MQLWTKWTWCFQAVLLLIFIAVGNAWAGQTLQTRCASIQIDDNGFITSLKSRQSGKEYSPAGHPSSLLSLHESNRRNDQLVLPSSALFNAEQHKIEIKFPNGGVATIKCAEKEDYFTFRLESLSGRGTVDNVVWGPLHTTVSKLIGDMIGVVRDDDWAIGMLGLDDNTIAGPPVDGDCYGMGYYIHSADPAKFPLPAQYKEGQWLNIGGNGVSDTAFYSHPEEYFHMVFGTGARLEPDFGSTIAYHARDRRRSYTYFWSLLPGFERSKPRHQVTDPMDVDFIGSGIALYACPDQAGLATIEKVLVGEGLPHPMINGKWIKDPTQVRPILNWNGPRDKCIEYTLALGLKDISRDTAEFYPCLGNHWVTEDLKYANGKTISFKDFTAEAHNHGLTNGGLHTLCVFLQSGVSNDVTPIPSEHLQTVCRTKLAKDISPTDTGITVTDPSFLSEHGTWPWPDANCLRIGTEMVKYDSISETQPYTLKGVQRGHGSKATSHQGGDEVAKLQQNVYNGFVPDPKLLLDYADYYADLIHRNGMDTIGFDGLESVVEANQGYYGLRIFCRRLSDTYARLTGGKNALISGSCVFAGAWDYMNSCNVGGGNNMFDPVKNHWGIEGKDIRNGFENNYFPGTFGIQAWQGNWSVYDAENLEAKSIGWDATYSLSVSQAVIDRTGERDAIFKSFKAWEHVRAANMFTKEQKERLQDCNYKFHLSQTGERTFVLNPIKEFRISAQETENAVDVPLTNPYESQALQLSLQVSGPANGFRATLPDGSQIKSDNKIEGDQYIICNGSQAYLADQFRKKISDLPLDHAAVLPAGESKFEVVFSGAAAKQHFDFTVWSSGKAQTVER